MNFVEVKDKTEHRTKAINPEPYVFRLTVRMYLDKKFYILISHKNFRR